MGLRSEGGGGGEGCGCARGEGERGGGEGSKIKMCNAVAAVGGCMECVRGI